MYNLTVPVEVKKIDINERIIIEWGDGKQRSTVLWEFKKIGETKTFITISNYDFQGPKDEQINQIRDSTSGFSFVIAGLKAWLEHKISLNLVADKVPE